MQSLIYAGTELVHVREKWHQNDMSKFTITIGKHNKAEGLGLVLGFLGTRRWAKSGNLPAQTISSCYDRMLQM